MRCTNPKVPYALTGKRVWVAGHRGMVGSALIRRLRDEDCEILTVARQDLDLRRQAEVEDWMAECRPQAVFMAAATVGGILANDTFPAKFLYDNLAIQTNVIHGAWRIGVEKLMMLGSACIYPKHAPQPMSEEALLTGSLEPTNEWYATAKIAAIKMCQAYRREYGCDFISAQPNNIFGPGDNFDLTSSHVVPALIAKAHDAKLSRKKDLEIWGTGTPRREFLYVEDLADALLFMMKHYSDEIQINVGSGIELTIRQLAEMVADIVGFEGKLAFVSSKPDGAPRKLLDTSRLKGLGWTATTGLREGLAQTYEWYVGAH